MSVVDDDVVVNPSANESLSEVLEAQVSRRSVLGGGAVAAAAAVFGGGISTLVQATPALASAPLGFAGIPTSTLDTVVVPPGYRWEVLIAWGDPLSSGPAFAPDASNTADEQAVQWGMHNDGIVYFPFTVLGDLYAAGGFVAQVLDRRPVEHLHGLFFDWERGSSTHGLIVQNHEYTDDGLLFPDGVANWSAAKTAKSLAAHGVSVIEVERVGGAWRVRRPSRFARRITGSTPITIAGPAAGHPLLRTATDPTGKLVNGTLNNCAMGYTPWGTYLACEENFNGYFRKTAPPNALEARYGINAAGFGYLWHTTDERFQVDKVPNEPNRFGWVTEIDPLRPTSTPVKRTALGRMKHEGATVTQTRSRRVVVYMGDDQRFEYIYRYVSDKAWRHAFFQGGHPLDEGTLFVARFKADGTGEWLPLTKANPALAAFATQADILINTRAAADAAGATKMDRPEWIDVRPDQREVFATLTNNSQRGRAGRPPTDAANPRANNVYGHVIRWRYQGDFDDPTFSWDIFALAGDPAVPSHGSTIVGDKFGSPDGIYVDPNDRLWIETDVSTSTINAGAYAGFGNNQMLAADLGTKEIRRFLVGPKQCEITGVIMTPDARSMFVGIQHPGERPDDSPGNPANPTEFSSFPGGPGSSRPRSSLLAITKDDSGQIGS